MSVKIPILSVAEAREVRGLIVRDRGRGSRLRSGTDSYTPRYFRIHSPVAIATATIAGATAPIKWSYTATEVRWNFDSSEWEDVPGGLVFEGALNTVEAGNDSGSLGPGYVVALIPSGWEYCPAGKAAGDVDVLCIRQVDVIRGRAGELQAHFTHHNTLDGSCP
jgi:hypothetical protein